MIILMHYKKLYIAASVKILLQQQLAIQGYCYCVDRQYTAYMLSFISYQLFYFLLSYSAYCRRLKKLYFRVH